MRSQAASADELERAKTTSIAPLLFGLESLGERANLLNQYNQATGDPGFLTKDVARYQRATADDVRRVAEQNLVKDARVVAIVRPTPGGPPRRPAGRSRPISRLGTVLGLVSLAALSAACSSRRARPTSRTSRSRRARCPTARRRSTSPFAGGCRGPRATSSSRRHASKRRASRTGFASWWSRVASFPSSRCSSPFVAAPIRRPLGSRPSPRRCSPRAPRRCRLDSSRMRFATSGRRSRAGPATTRRTSPDVA